MKRVVLLTLLVLISCKQILDWKPEERSATDPAGGGGGLTPTCVVEMCPDPSSDCMETICAAEGCSERPHDPHKACETAAGGMVCDGQGNCVVCIKGLGECPDFAFCDSHEDCDSGVCAATAPEAPKVCRPASCFDDMIQNGNESDVNCGGPESGCEQCDQGEKCTANDNCKTGFCIDGICCGTRCEGICRSCAAGTGACTYTPFGGDPDEECPEDPNNPNAGFNLCDGAGSCTACNDGNLDLTLGETGLNCQGMTCTSCGGPVCESCNVGVSCVAPTDCTSCNCASSVCAVAECNNSVQDLCETDEDCGGPCGPTCGHGQGCVSKADCASFKCVEFKCVGP